VPDVTNKVKHPINFKGNIFEGIMDNIFKRANKKNKFKNNLLINNT